MLINLIEQILKLALSASHNGRHDRDPLAAALLEDALDDLFGGLSGDGTAAVGAVRRADRGVKQAQVVVNLGDGADSGARAAAGGLLLDGDGRAKPFDGVNIGALDLVEKLARIGGKRFDVAALAFGVDGVKGERTFARSGKSGNDREGVAGNADVDIAQVMLARPAHRDVRDRHEGFPDRRGAQRCNLEGLPITKVTLVGILFVNRNQGQRGTTSATIA